MQHEGKGWGQEDPLRLIRRSSQSFLRWVQKNYEFLPKNTIVTTGLYCQQLQWLTDAILQIVQRCFYTTMLVLMWRVKPVKNFYSWAGSRSLILLTPLTLRPLTFMCFEIFRTFCKAKLLKPPMKCRSQCVHSLQTRPRTVTAKESLRCRPAGVMLWRMKDTMCLITFDLKKSWL